MDLLVFLLLRNKEPLLSRWQMGGRSVIAWASIGFKKKGNLVFLSIRVNSEDYHKLLEGQKNKHNFKG